MVEIAGIGPGQFCGMLLADMGADVIRVARPGGAGVGIQAPPQFNLMNRSRPTITADLKSPKGKRLVLRLCKKADALFEGYRPGTMERLGLGPDDCMGVNPRLVYGRMTVWGQDGPLADSAGHDGNYAAISGAIGAIGARDGAPAVPLNLVADLGGGGAYLAIGLLAALLEAGRSGQGQVIDAAMVDGTASMMTMFYGLHAGGLWRDERGCNVLDGGAPFYRPYRTSDGEYVMVCAIEPRFFAVLLDVLQATDIDPREQMDPSKWGAQIVILEALFAMGTRDHWSTIFAGTDACVAPVMSLAEAPRHPQNQARRTFVDIDGVVQPAPAPRFSRTPSAIRSAAGSSEADIERVLAEWQS